MSTWNYRVYERQDGEEKTFGIIETYYDGNGDRNGFSDYRDTYPVGDSLNELRAELERMLKALDEPTIVWDEASRSFF